MLKPIPISAPEINSDLKKSKELMIMPVTKSRVPKILLCVGFKDLLTFYFRV